MSAVEETPIITKRGRGRPKLTEEEKLQRYEQHLSKMREVQAKKREEDPKHQYDIFQRWRERHREKYNSYMRTINQKVRDRKKEVATA